MFVDLKFALNVLDVGPLWISAGELNGPPCTNKVFSYPIYCRCGQSPLSFGHWPRGLWVGKLP